MEIKGECSGRLDTIRGEEPTELGPPPTTELRLGETIPHPICGVNKKLLTAFWCCVINAPVTENPQTTETMGKPNSNGLRNLRWRLKAKLSWTWILRNRPDVAKRLRRKALQLASRLAQLKEESRADRP